MGGRTGGAQSDSSTTCSDPQDEVFLYRFGERPELVQPWTSDRRDAGLKLKACSREGGTAMYDAVAAAIPGAAGHEAQEGAGRDLRRQRHEQSIRVTELTRLIRVMLVYAIGIDASGSGPSAS